MFAYSYLLKVGRFLSVLLWFPVDINVCVFVNNDALFRSIYDIYFLFYFLECHSSELRLVVIIVSFLFGIYLSL